MSAVCKGQHSSIKLGYSSKAGKSAAPSVLHTAEQLRGRKRDAQALVDLTGGWECQQQSAGSKDGNPSNLSACQDSTCSSQSFLSITHSWCE